MASSETLSPETQPTPMFRKIHLVHLSSAPGGIEVLMPVIMKNLPERNFNAFVIRKGNGEKSVYDHLPLEIHYGSNRNLQAFFKTWLYAYRNRHDVFHAFNIGPLFLLLVRLGGVKRIVYGIHGTIYWKNRLQRKVYRFLWRLALGKSIALVANSEYSRNEFRRKISSRFEIDVLYNPIDTRRFTPPADLGSQNTIKIIFCGRLVQGKNLSVWIDVASQIHKQMPETRFDLYGDGPLKTTLQQQIGKLNADEFIHINEFRQDVEAVYREADLFLFLSEYESFGNVVVESILCGTPVLASPLPSMQEIFSGYPQFLLRDGKDLKEQVLEKLKQVDELKRLAACAREKFQKQFSVCRHISSLKQTYDACEK